MWNKSLLDNGQYVNYRINENMFEAECCINIECDKSVSLYAVSSGKENSELCIGSFSDSDGRLQIRKKYSLEYMNLNNIYPQSEIGFSVKDSDGKIITGTLKTTDDTNGDECTENEEDFALLRAREILESFRCHNAEPSEAARVARNTQLILNGFPPADITCFGKFRWYRIDSIEETFYLSGVGHLIFESDFILNFARWKEWYFGCCDERLFAVCIKTESEVSPFVNASDCAEYEKDGSVYYHAVGIALLDDGQYFYNPKGIAN